MDLEHVRLRCETLIDHQQGNIKYWTAYQMLDVVTDLLRCIENQRTDPHLAEQLSRTIEEYRAVLEENRRLNEGRLWTTFRHEDGSPVMGEYAWMGEIDAFEEEAWDGGEQVRVVSETWRLVDTMVILVGTPPEPDDEDDDAPPDRVSGG